MRKKKKHIKVVKKHKKAAFLFKMLLFILIIITFFAASTIFFEIKDIKVIGDTRYKPEEIIVASEISVGDNLIFIEKISMAKRILNKYIHIDEVRINRIFPKTLEIKIKEKRPVFVYNEDGKNVVLDAKGTYIDNTDKPENYIQILGLEPVDLHIGKNIFDSGVETVKSLKILLTALNNEKMVEHISIIDIKEEYNLNFRYKNKFNVKIGDIYEIEKKLRFLKTVEERLTDSDEGDIDLSDLTIARFVPKEK